jgi:hypothetical protein
MKITNKHNVPETLMTLSEQEFVFQGQGRLLSDRDYFQPEDQKASVATLP